MTISSANWPSFGIVNEGKYKALLAQGYSHGATVKAQPKPLRYAINDLEVRSSLLKLTVYLESLDVQVETQSPKYEWSSFLSNIGGVMGFFTGFYILSFFKIVEWLVDLGSNMISVI